MTISLLMRFIKQHNNEKDFVLKFLDICRRMCRIIPLWTGLALGIEKIIRNCSYCRSVKRLQMCR